MKKLASIERQLTKEELLNEFEIANVKGGRRYITRVYSFALQIINLLKSYGLQYEMNKHNDEYCIEW